MNQVQIDKILRQRKDFRDHISLPSEDLLRDRVYHCLLCDSCEHLGCMSYRCSDYKPKHAKNS